MFELLFNFDINQLTFIVLCPLEVRYFVKIGFMATFNLLPHAKNLLTLVKVEKNVVRKNAH